MNHHLLAQFVSPAEVRQARRWEARGLGSAEVYVTDLMWCRMYRLLTGHSVFAAVAA